MKYNVLIVDDSKVIRQSLKRTFSLAALEADFQEAENGKTALDFIDGNKFDIMFLDINMPVMTGVEVVDNLVSTGKIPNIPIVIVSTEGNEERVSYLLDKGAKAYLRKPVSPEKLVATINDILGEKK